MAPKAVMITTGTVGSMRRTPSRTSRPSTPFMRRSVTTTSLGSRAKRSSARTPPPAISVSNPVRSRSLAMVWAMSITSSTTKARSLRMGLRLQRPRDGGPEHGHRGALPRCAREVYLARVIANDAGGDGETEPRALSMLLGCEEGIEHRVHILGGDPAAPIGHLEANQPDVGPARGQRHPLPGIRGVAGVEQQVDQDLLKLIGIGGQRRQAAGNGD